MYRRPYSLHLDLDRLCNPHSLSLSKDVYDFQLGNLSEHSPLSAPRHRFSIPSIVHNRSRLRLPSSRQSLVGHDVAFRSSAEVCSDCMRRRSNLEFGSSFHVNFPSCFQLHGLATSSFSSPFYRYNRFQGSQSAFNILPTHIDKLPAYRVAPAHAQDAS